MLNTYADVRKAFFEVRLVDIKNTIWYIFLHNTFFKRLIFTVKLCSEISQEKNRR